MKTNIQHIIILLFISTIGYTQVKVTGPEGTYLMDKAFSDYALGKIMYESYKYTAPEEYKNARIKAIEMITRSAESGYSPAQFYLGTIYLNDTLVKDYKIGVELLKKSAYKRNNDAIALLERLDEEYEVAVDYQFWYRIIVISLSMLLYLIFSLLVHRKISKSSLITQKHKKRLKAIVWLMPYIGAIIGIYKHNKIVIPLDREDINWVRNSFEWIRKEFGNDLILKTAIVLPKNGEIPFELNHTKESVIELVYFVADKMQINRDEIEVDFYNQSQMELDGNFVTQQYEDDNYSSGQYWGKKLNGKYQISLGISELKNPIGLTATIAHELSHIKLLGEKRIKENDEYLTDLIPIIFGFGIFSANSVFLYQQDSFGWRTNSQGYLNERMYGFALATFAKIRNELNPVWGKHLSATVREEFERSMIYLKENE